MISKLQYEMNVLSVIVIFIYSSVGDIASSVICKQCYTIHHIPLFFGSTLQMVELWEEIVKIKLIICQET